MDEVTEESNDPTVLNAAGLSNEATNETSATLPDENETKDIENKEQDDENKDEIKPEVKKVQGISITRSLVLFGYESWVALEPGE